MRLNQNRQWKRQQLPKSTRFRKALCPVSWEIGRRLKAPDYDSNSHSKTVENQLSPSLRPLTLLPALGLLNRLEIERLPIFVEFTFNNRSTTATQPIRARLPQPWPVVCSVARTWSDHMSSSVSQTHRIMRANWKCCGDVVGLKRWLNLKVAFQEQQMLYGSRQA